MDKSEDKSKLYGIFRYLYSGQEEPIAEDIAGLDNQIAGMDLH